MSDVSGLACVPLANSKLQPGEPVLLVTPGGVKHQLLVAKPSLTLLSGVTIMAQSTLVPEARGRGDGGAMVGITWSSSVRPITGCWGRLPNLDGALSVIMWSSHNSNLWLFLLSLTLMGGCLLNQLAFLFWCSLYDIFWSSEVDDELRALEESKPEVKIIS